MGREEMNRKMSKVIDKARSDADFKARLLENPVETLMTNKVDELSEEDLGKVAGGGGGGRCKGDDKDKCKGEGKR